VSGPDSCGFGLCLLLAAISIRSAADALVDAI